LKYLYCHLPFINDLHILWLIIAADFMNFTIGGQPLVDAAFLCQALLRAPTQLWGRLSTQDKERVVSCLKSTRIITPGYSNWLL